MSKKSVIRQTGNTQLKQHRSSENAEKVNRQIQGYFNTSKQLLQSLKKEKDFFQKQNDALSKDNKQLREQLDNLEDQVILLSSIQDEFNKIVDERNLLVNTIETLNRENKELMGRCVQLEQEILVENKRRATAEETLDELQKQVDEFEEIVNLLQKGYQLD